LFGFGKKEEEAPLKGVLIEDYALLGDCETAALVSREGSIDWLCWPTFSSAACFAALLGTSQNGYWQLRPVEEIQSVSRRYRPGTMVLETTFVTKSGEVCVTDFMPPRGKNSDVIRIVKGVRGKVAMSMELVIRFDYGLTIPWVTRYKDELHAVAGPNMVVLRTECSKGPSVAFEGEDMKTVSEFKMTEHDKVCFTLTYGPSNKEIPERVLPEKALEETVAYWCEWTNRADFDGPYEEAVARSLMTLKALTYRPTSGMVAAATAGLPELIGGERNWDYRFCWLRDTSFTLLVLMLAGYTEEAVGWRLWLLRAIAGTPDQLQSLYGISGERMLQEWEAPWLRGYGDSKPVRFGNGAATQFQLDVYGEVAVALFRTPQADQDIRVPSQDLQAKLIDHLCHIWDQPDDGIWEVRSARQHFVHSKVMAWVALDRAIKNYEKYNGKGDVKRWKKNRDMLREEILEKGFSKKLNSFVQSYGSEALDASCLRIAFVGFLPTDDPRIIGTVDAIQKQLTKNGLVQRYEVTASPDGLKGGEGTFLPCSFWMVTALHLIGRVDEARAMFDRLLQLRNDVGLLSEEYDPVNNRMLGNFPQALTHIGLVHAAFTITGKWHPERVEEYEK